MSPCERLLPSRNSRKRSAMTISAPPDVKGLCLFCFHKAHRDADHPAHNLRLARIRKTPNLAFRVRVRNRREVPVLHLAPAADVFASQLNEIDRPFVLVL